MSIYLRNRSHFVNKLILFYESEANLNQNEVDHFKLKHKRL